jgi:hypothetical protein
VPTFFLTAGELGHQLLPRGPRVGDPETPRTAAAHQPEWRTELRWTNPKIVHLAQADFPSPRMLLDRSDYLGPKANDIPRKPTIRANVRTQVAACSPMPATPAMSRSDVPLFAWKYQMRALTKLTDGDADRAPCAR